MTAPTGEDVDIREELRRTGRRYTRAKETLQTESEKLAALAIRAHAAGLKPADVSRAADHAITPERVRQIIRDHEKATVAE